MTIWWHPKTGRVLFLCFHGCQWFPEPFKATGLPSEEWERIDMWQPQFEEKKPMGRKPSR